MIALTLAQIADATGGRVVGDPGLQLDGPVVTDSRRVADNSLFVALRGARVDGHDYLGAASEGGAVAALVSREVHGAALAQVVVADTETALGDLARFVLDQLRQQPKAPVVVAITGSVGKTSTRDLLDSVLEGKGEVIAPAGSYNNEVGLPLTVLRATADTAVLVLEMGADAPGNLTYLTSIAAPDIAVVLAVGRAHLGGFGTIEAVATAKAELVQGMRPQGVAILNGDDARVAAMAPLVAGERTVVYGTGSGAEVQASDVSTDDAGRPRFTLSTPTGQVPVALALFGEHQVSNALAAAAVARELQLDLPQIAALLGTSFARSPHRMDVHKTSSGVTIIDDAYNANPDSMRAALRALADMAKTSGGRAIAVLGPMRELGPDSTAEHTGVGQYAANLGVDQLIAVEGEARPIAEGALAAGMPEREVTRATGVTEAVSRLRRSAKSGDVVLVKASNGVQLWRVVSELEGNR